MTACAIFYYPQYNQHMSGWNAVCVCVCVCVTYKCGKTGEVLEETWAAKKSEGQDTRAEGGIKRRVGCRMVARVTVRVATPYVNPPIWSILQSKRIGFLWRWISSAGKLFLSLSLLSHLFYLLFLLLWLFFPLLIVIPCVISQLTGFLSSPCLLSLTMMVFIRPHQDRHDLLWYFPNANLSLTPKRLKYVLRFLLYVCALFLSPGLSQRWQGGCNRQSLAWLPFFFKCHTILLPSAAHGSWWNMITHWYCLMCSTMEGTN